MLAPRGAEALVVVPGESPDVVDHDEPTDGSLSSAPPLTTPTPTPAPSKARDADDAKLDALRRLFVAAPPLRAFVRYAQTPASTSDEDLVALFELDSPSAATADDAASDDEDDAAGDDAGGALTTSAPRQALRECGACVSERLFWRSQS